MPKNLRLAVIAVDFRDVAIASFEANLDLRASEGDPFGWTDPDQLITLYVTDRIDSSGQTAIDENGGGTTP